MDKKISVQNHTMQTNYLYISVSHIAFIEIEFVTEELSDTKYKYFIHTIYI